jgi:hypothetical protein
VTFLPRRIAALFAATAAVFGTLALPAQLAAAGSIPAPVLTAPADNTTTPLKDVVLKWDSVSGASKYQVQVSPNGEWTNNTVTLAGNGVTVATVFEMPISLPHASYFWRVRAQVGGSWGPYATPREFLREWDAPITILNAPDNNDPTVVWAPVQDASVYEISFSTAPDFDKSKTESCLTNNTSFTPYGLETASEKATGDCFGEGDLTDGKAYYWRLIPLDDTTAPAISADTANDPAFECAAASPECDADYFVSTPLAFVFGAPAAGATAPDPFTPVTGLTTTWHSTSIVGTACDSTSACPTTPTFSWDPVTDANYYQVQIYHDPAMSNVYRVFNTAWPELTPRDSFFDAQAGHAYYWRVVAGTCENSATDKTCAKTAASSATASCPSGSGSSGPTISDVSPSSVQGGTSATITLTGTNFQNPPCVEGGGDGSISDVVWVSATEVQFTYNAPTADATVNFDVVNPDGAKSASSPELTVNGGSKINFYEKSALESFDKLSGSVPLTSPSTNATVHGRSITFNWGDFQANGGQGSYDARNYELQVSKSSTFTSTVINHNDIDLTQYTDPSGALADGNYFWRVAPIDESGNLLTWSATHDFAVDATGPSVRLTTKSGVGLHGPLKIHFSEPIDGVSASTVRIVARGTGHAAAGKITATADPRNFTFTPSKPLVTGQTYVLSLSSSLVDSNGNHAVVTGGGVRTTLVAKDNSPGWSFSSGWHRMSASGARSGNVKVATAGHSASIVVVGTTARLYGCKAPNMGKITVTVGGHSTTVNEHQSFTRCGFVLWHKALGHGEQKIKVTVAHGRGNIDELAVR